MDVELHELLVNAISGLVSSGFVVAHGGGEPLIHPHFLRLLEHIRRAGNLAAGFLTNGILLTPELGRSILELGVREIGFSLPGACREDYRLASGQDSWARVEENISTFLELVRARSGPRPFTRVHLMRGPETPQAIEDFIRRWLGRVDEVVVLARRGPTGRTLAEGLPSKARRRPCHRLIEPLTIAWTGEVYLCCEDWHGECVIGDARRESLEEIQGRRWRSILAHRLGRTPEAGLCRDCVSWQEREVSTFRNGDWLEMVSPLWRRVRLA